MKIVILIICVYLSNFCISQVRKDNCKENLKFQRFFFENISIIKTYGKVGEKIVSKALDEINLYVKVGDFEILGYGGVRYNSDIICNELIKTYIEWYEQNKCRNLKKHRKKFYRVDYEPIR